MPTRFPRRAALALALAAALLSCKKSSETKVSWDDTDRPDAVAGNKAAAPNLSAPPLFAAIPADTPFVFAAFTPIPGDYWKRACEEMCPALEKLLGQASTAAARSGGGDARLAGAVMGELAGNLSAAGLRKLGLSPEPRFALYGLGPLPVVRIEVADPAALAATVGRIEQRSGVKLPTRTQGGQSFWFGTSGGSTLAAGVVGKELVLTLGPAPAVERAIPILYGGEKLPGPTMADGAALKKLAADYGFAGYGLGYVDFQRLAALGYGDEQSIHGEMWKLAHGGGEDDGITSITGAAVPAAGAPALPPATGGKHLGAPAMPDPDDEPMPMRPPDPDPIDAGADDMIATADAGVGNPPPTTIDQAACKAQVTALAARFPRAVFGYDEISAKRASFSATLETDAATVKQLKALETRSPGVSTRLPDEPLAAFGGAIDVKAARAMAGELRGVWRKTAAVCGFSGGGGDDDDDGGSFDLPGGLSPDALRGGLVVIQGGDLGGGLPSNIAGYAIVGVSDPTVLASLGDLLKMVGVKDFKADGKFHSLDLGKLGPFSGAVKQPVKVAARDQALVVAAGDRARATAEKAMAQTGGRSPLFMFAYDVGRVAKGMSGIFDKIGSGARGVDMDDDPMGGAMMAFGKDLIEAEGRLFGLVVFSLHATDRGLGMVGRMDLR